MAANQLVILKPTHICDIQLMLSCRCLTEKLLGPNPHRGFLSAPWGEPDILHNFSRGLSWNNEIFINIDPSTKRNNTGARNPWQWGCETTPWTLQLWCRKHLLHGYMFHVKDEMMYIRSEAIYSIYPDWTGRLSWEFFFFPFNSIPSPHSQTLRLWFSNYKF